MSCDNYDNAYYGACRPDVPYPSTSAESVPSLIDNLTQALYGIYGSPYSIQKSVVNGRVIWTIPCDPNNTSSINGFARNTGEGLLCYILRYLGQSSIGTTVVYTGSTQTLTNKTLTGPVITNPTVTGGTIDGSTIGTNSPVTILSPVINGTIAGTGTFDAARLTGSTLPTFIQISSSNIPSGTVIASDLAATLDLTGKVISLPTNTTLTSSNTVGGIVYGSTTSQLSQLSVGTAGQILVSQGTGLAPSWSKDHIGVSDSSNASFGYVGEFVSNAIIKANGVTLPTATATTITSISLSAGDWDVRGQVDYTCGNGTTAIQVYYQGISTTNNTLGATDTYSVLNLTGTSTLPGVSIDQGLPCKTTRISIGSTTTVYLVAQVNFNGTGASVKGYGTIEARRMR
jgi:hypothetical protein